MPVQAIGEGGFPVRGLEEHAAAGSLGTTRRDGAHTPILALYAQARDRGRRRSIFYAARMASEAGILARGPWPAERISGRWREEPWRAPAELERRADAAVAALRERGSPAHDGLAARLLAFEASADGLALEMEPARWSLRLVEGDTRSLTALCIVRREDGCWLAGRRAAWLASWAGRWALGAGGSVEQGENPALTLTRELEEEWQLVPAALSVEALVALPSGLVALVGLASVPADAKPVPDAEHDEFAWWPSDPARWPADADPGLARMAEMLNAGTAGGIDPRSDSSADDRRPSSRGG